MAETVSKGEPGRDEKVDEEDNESNNVDDSAVEYRHGMGKG